MRILVRILIMLLALQTAGAYAWTSTDAKHDQLLIASQQSHHMDMDSTQANTCCEMDKDSLEDCALKCLSGCSTIVATFVIEAEYEQGRVAEQHPPFLHIPYVSFSPLLETPPPSV